MLRYMWQRWLVCPLLDDTVRVGRGHSQNDTEEAADVSRGSLTLLIPNVSDSPGDRPGALPDDVPVIVGPPLVTTGRCGVGLWKAMIAGDVYRAP